jgi:hypothetical protein
MSKQLTTQESKDDDDITAMIQSLTMTSKEVTNIDISKRCVYIWSSPESAATLASWASINWHSEWGTSDYKWGGVFQMDSSGVGGILTVFPFLTPAGAKVGETGLAVADAPTVLLLGTGQNERVPQKTIQWQEPDFVQNVEYPKPVHPDTTDFMYVVRSYVVRTCQRNGQAYVRAIETYVSTVGTRKSARKVKPDEAKESKGDDW